MTAPAESLTDALIGFITTRLAEGRAVTAETDLLAGGILDSLSVMGLVAHIEAEAGITVAPQDLTIENFATVSAMAAFIARKQAG